MVSLATLKGPPPYLTRLEGLAPLAPEEVQSLQAVTLRAPVLRARREIVGEGEPVRQPRLLLSGWAARVRDFANGRRQILHVLLPGDLIDLWQQQKPVAVGAVVALTDVRVAPAPNPLGPTSGLAQAYVSCGEIEQRYLFRQIARLGRLDAYERLADLFLELHERLRLVGDATDDTFPLPMTQEMLADTLGLTSVHLNRTLQLMRRENVLELHGNTVRMLDADRLRALVEYQSVPTHIQERRSP